ncbi:hypothetical protein RYX36_032751 [Vicia faba]
MDEILLTNEKTRNDGSFELLSQQTNVLPRNSELSSANGFLKQRPISQAELSQKLKDELGYTLIVKPFSISHTEQLHFRSPPVPVLPTHDNLI